MSWSFVVVGVVLLLLTATALFTTNAIVRAAIVAALLVSSFLFVVVSNTSMVHKQFDVVKAAASDPQCSQVWWSAQRDAQERFWVNTRTMFGVIAGLALIAVSPRRKK